MRGEIALCALTLATLVIAYPTARAEVEQTAVEIPFEKFVLDNGLRVIIHQDNKAPVVGVAVWYHVGSKDEPPGKTGFAHLFEHLMFEGTENYDKAFSEPFESAGTIQQNGTTWFDRTNYFETVPTPALEMALWMESERMGHLLGAVSQEKLDQERAVVKNEKRQGDNQPYGMVIYRILEGLFPPGHPYRHDTIGSMEDLDAASLEDVRDWFRQYYGAANAVLVMAGDLSPDTGLALAQRYFGDIDPGPPLARMQSWVPERSNDTHETMIDEVPHTRTYQYWAVPGRTQRDRALLQLAASVLGDGKNSRLYQALVLETGLAVDVSVSLEPHELASVFSITATLAPEAALESVTAIIDAELSLLIRFGPGEEELERARARFNANLIRGLERVGGFTGKAAVLASGELYDGRPDFYRTLSAWINGAQTEEIRVAAERWLSRGRYRLDVLPAEDLTVSDSQLDRSLGVPPVLELPEVEFPMVERTTLRNGIEVVLARRTALPLVNVSIQFDAGYAADAGDLPGLSSFTLAMLEESTASHTALEVEALAESLGAEIDTSADLDTSVVILSALSTRLEPSLELFADVVRNPAFSEEELERQRIRWLARIESEWSDPLGIALHTLPPLVYGPDHAYGIPLTGSGTAQSIVEIDRTDVENFHNRWHRADNASLFLVGDTTMAEVKPMLDKHFGDWSAPELELPGKVVATVPLPETASIHIADRPGSPQTLIMAAHLVPPTQVEDNLGISVMDDIFGGSYSSRLNRVIRVEKGWAYGAYTWMQDARGQRLWALYAPVQIEATTEAMTEMLEMVEAYRESEPATDFELERSVKSSTNSLPGRFETSSAVMATLLNNYRFSRPDDYIETLKPRLEALSLEAVRESAVTHLHPSRLTWVVVGDLGVIRGAVEAFAEQAGIEQIHMLDFENN